MIENCLAMIFMLLRDTITTATFISVIEAGLWFQMFQSITISLRSMATSQQTWRCRRIWKFNFMVCQQQQETVCTVDIPWAYETSKLDFTVTQLLGKKKTTLTPTKPHLLIVPLTMDQTFKSMSLWESVLSKLSQSTPWMSKAYSCNITENYIQSNFTNPHSLQ